ncbi:MAG: HAMP domain-containing protein, partial [Cycloclasticus sp.]|nr:HAMP domain-containing protein [Cycloclasticus sp.]
MAAKTLRKRAFLIPAGVLLSLLLSLYLMSHATQSSSQFNELFSSLILLNIIGTVFLFGLLVVNIHWLWQQFKKQAVGSRITLKIVLLFFAISVIPTSVVFYFSSQLLHQSVDSWFDVQIDDAMKNSLKLSQRSLDNRTRSLMKETRQLTEALENESDMFLSLTLSSLREQTSASELTAFSKQGQIIATTNLDPSVLIPNTPDDAMLLLVRQSGEFIGIEPSSHEGLIVRTLVEIKNSNPKRYLQAIYTVPRDLGELASSVESAYTAYQEFNYLRQSLKFSFTLTLALVLVFSLLVASWAAFVFARELVEPIRQLVKGTQAVAQGDYEKKLEVDRKDELGFLVNS